MSSENQFLAQRREKARNLADLGVKLYSNTFKPADRISDLRPKAVQLEPQQKEEGGASYSIAGRIMAMRKFGKAAFITLADATGQMQVYVRKDSVGDEQFSGFKKYDIGDIVGAGGHLFKTKTGELSVWVERLRLMTKSLRPLPEKFHGLSDQEQRYRQRYVDLIMNEGSREVFRLRSRIVKYILDYLDTLGFQEV